MRPGSSSSHGGHSGDGSCRVWVIFCAHRCRNTAFLANDVALQPIHGKTPHRSYWPLLLFTSYLITYAISLKANHPTHENNVFHYIMIFICNNFILTIISYQHMELMVWYTECGLYSGRPNDRSTQMAPGVRFSGPLCNAQSPPSKSLINLMHKKAPRLFPIFRSFRSCKPRPHPI